MTQKKLSFSLTSLIICSEEQENWSAEVKR